MMARFNRLHPVNSQKHEITWSDLAINGSTTQVKNLAIGTEPSAINISTEVAIGAHIGSIYFEINFAAEDITTPKVIHWEVLKSPFGTTMSVPSLYNQDDKRFVLKRGMEMLPKSVSTVYKRVFVVRIPPRIRRAGDGDKFQFQYVCSSAETVNVCGFAIYKEIR